MLFRAIALSLALLIGMTTVIPFITNSAEAIPKNTNKKKKKLKKYSKAWWRWYHKQKRAKRAFLARKRAIKAKQILLARQRANKPKQLLAQKPIEKATEIIEAKTDKVAKPITKIQESENEVHYPVNDNDGKSLGKVLLSIVGTATTEDSQNAGNKIGGIATSALRRNVVDKMVKEDGWVVNDYHKTVNGKKVYVVVAQSPTKSGVQSRLFYFTEVDGKIYNLSTSSPNESQERIATES
ncbi:MAG: hypothetical protein AAB336_12445, partial [Acidobacteriota bacterium]